MLPLRLGASAVYFDPDDYRFPPAGNATDVETYPGWALISQVEPDATGTSSVKASVSVPRKSAAH